MPTLTKLIKESLEGKLTDQIRVSLEAEDEMNEAKKKDELFVDSPEAENEIKKRLNHSVFILKHIINPQVKS